MTSLKREEQKRGPKKATYKPTVREQASLDKLAVRTAAASPAPRILVTDAPSGLVVVDHPDYDVACRLLMEALGTSNADFINGIIRQLFDAGSKLDESKFNFMLAVIKDANPKDQVEAMLAAQMAVVHVSLMKFAQHFEKFETTHQQDSAVGALAKLGRTFTAQMDALKRYRTGGEQKITVQHVVVQDGGQAIVGNVIPAASETALKKPIDSVLALADVGQTAMPIIEERTRSRVPLRRETKTSKT